MHPPHAREVLGTRGGLRLTRLLAVALLAVAAVAPVHARSLADSTTMPPATWSGMQRLSLAGLVGLSVEVTVQCPSQQFTQLVSSEVLRSQVELKLRSAGIRVYEDVASNSDPRLALLSLSVNAVRSDGNDQGDPLAYAMAMQLSLGQKVWVVARGIPVRWLIGDTWERSAIMCYGSTPLKNVGLTKQVADWMDTFVNDWLAAHSR